jgi:hypothetical protein
MLLEILPHGDLGCEWNRNHCDDIHNNPEVCHDTLRFYDTMHRKQLHAALKAGRTDCDLNPRDSNPDQKHDGKNRNSWKIQIGDDLDRALNRNPNDDNHNNPAVFHEIHYFDGMIRKKLRHVCQQVGRIDCDLNRRDSNPDPKIYDSYRSSLKIRIGDGSDFVLHHNPAGDIHNIRAAFLYIHRSCDTMHKRPQNVCLKVGIHCCD